VRTRHSIQGFEDFWYVAVDSPVPDDSYRIIACTSVHRLPPHGAVDPLARARELAGVVLVRSQTDAMPERVPQGWPWFQTRHRRLAARGREPPVSDRQRPHRSPPNAPSWSATALLAADVSVTIVAAAPEATADCRMPVRLDRPREPSPLPIDRKPVSAIQREFATEVRKRTFAGVATFAPLDRRDRDSAPTRVSVTPSPISRRCRRKGYGGRCLIFRSVRLQSRVRSGGLRNWNVLDANVARPVVDSCPHRRTDWYWSASAGRCSGAAS
jgi:hypothetical protein